MKGNLTVWTREQIETAQRRASLCAQATFKGDEIRELLETALSATWIKCSDRMPEKNVPVLAWFSNGSYPIWATYYDQEWCGTLGMHELIYPDYEISHWKSIKPPQA